MARDQFDVGVVTRLHRQRGPWGGDEWRPFAVLPAVPDAAPGASLAGDGAERISYSGTARIVLHAAETAHYRDNLASGRPSLWVALETTADDGVRIAAITADPYEGEALAGAMGLTVDPVAMPPEIARWVGAFVAEFHVERVFVKRKRDRAEPEAAPPRRPFVPGGVAEK